MKLPREIKIYVKILLIVFAFYFIFSSVAPSSKELFLWVIATITLLTVPLLIKKEKKEEKEEERKIMVRNDIAHFRETVNKALNENPVAQRDVELELLNVLRIDMGIRYSLSDREIRENMGNEDFMRKYFGNKWKIIKEIYDRKHELRKSVPKDEFRRDINTLMEVMR